MGDSLSSQPHARVVELVDTGDSKSPAVTGLPVRVRPRVPMPTWRIEIIEKIGVCVHPSGGGGRFATTRSPRQRSSPVPPLAGARPGLAHAVRGTATQRDRQQSTDHADESGGHHQPVTLIEAGKLSPRAVEGSGPDQTAGKFQLPAVQGGGAVHPENRLTSKRGRFREAGWSRFPVDKSADPRGRSGGLSFDVRFQAFQCAIPFRADLYEKLVRVLEAWQLQTVSRFPPLFLRRNKLSF